MIPPPTLPPPPNEALDYQAQTPVPRRPPVDVGTVTMCIALAGMFTFTLLLVVPRFEAGFASAGMQLPLATVLLVKFTRTVAAAPIWLGVVWAIAAVPVAISIPLGPLGRRILRGLLYLVLVAMIVGLALALVMPYIALINSISGKKG
jgi:hypothetical protein